MKNISLGRYVPHNSFIHRLDPRTKIIVMFFLMVAVFLPYVNTAMNFAALGIIALVIIVLLIISKIGILSIFKQLRALWIMFIFILLINIFFIKTGDFFYVFGTDWKIHYGAIWQTLYIFCRLFLMIALTTVLTSTTRPLDLTFALEWFMTPLKIIKFPAHIIAMTISLALRFIPTLLEETERIMKAQASRGVDFISGRFKEKVKAIIALIIPLFISAILRSDELANAMEARGYDPSASRTRYRIMKWKLRDSFMLLFAISFSGALLTVSIMKLDLINMIGAWF